MLLHIARKELLDQMLSLRFAIACAVCLLAFLLSFGLMARDYREAVSTYHMNQTLHRNELVQRSELWALWEGIKVDRPLNELNILVRGVTGRLTEGVRVQDGGQLEFTEGYEDNAVAALFPAVDYVFIVGVIMSLLALAFSYDAVSGERESGVLRLLMSFAVPRDRVILGKWLGGYVGLVGPFLIAFVAGLLIAVVILDVRPDLDGMLSILGLLVLALLYVAAVYSLGLLVSARTETASTSITVLLLLWVVLILAVPNMSPYVATQLLPIPTRESVDRQKQEVRKEGDRKIGEMIEAEQERTGAVEVWDDPDFGARLRETWEGVLAEERKVEDSYAVKVQWQTQWSGMLARLSPLASFNLAAYDLAAAGIAQEARFVEALKEYSNTWEEYGQRKREAFEELQRSKREEQQRGEILYTSAEMEEFNKLDFSDYPHFDFEYMGFRDRLGLVYLDVLLLALWNILFFMVAYVSFLRSEVS